MPLHAPNVGETQGSASIPAFPFSFPYCVINAAFHCNWKTDFGFQINRAEGGQFLLCSVSRALSRLHFLVAHRDKMAALSHPPDHTGGMEKGKEAVPVAAI